MKDYQEKYLTIRESMYNYFISPCEVVISYDPFKEYYSICIGRADGEEDCKVIDLTPEEFDQIRRFNL